MNNRHCLAIALLALGATAAGTAAAGPVTNETGPNLVINGGFETGDFSGWTSAVDPVFSGVDVVAAHSGNDGAYFGDAGTPGSIRQSIATVAGAAYDIRFWFRSDGSAPNGLQVLWGGTSVYSVTDVGAFPYTEILIDPLATTGSTTLEFRVRDDNGFLELDDIAVRRVPEPSELALFAPALLGLVAVRRRKS